MTRSSARRRNCNARLLASHVFALGLALANAADAQRFFTRKHWYGLLHPEVTEEVNWDYCAELLNRAANRFLS